MGTYKENIVLFIILIDLKLSSCLGDHRQEAHNIMKRMSEAGEVFEGHDVAHIMLVEGQRKRRLVKRDLRGISNPTDNDHIIDLQLQLSSGSQVNLALRSADIVDPDTKVSYLTTKGSLVRNLRDTDCYSYGHIVDSSGDGWAAISHCDGLFGFAGSSRYEYFIHPVEWRRSKRDVNEEFDVHVMWRHSISQTNVENIEPRGEVHEDNLVYEDVRDGSSIPLEDMSLSSQLPGSDEDRINATGFVIEMAMFSDAQFWEELQQLYPGREDDFLLIRMAAAQALYSDREKVGYDVRIKVKLLEYWITNPQLYIHENNLVHNLQHFCLFTRDRYFYDVHVLNTRIMERKDRKVGFAYSRGMCSPFRCIVSLSNRMNRYNVYAHELGHNFGMTHFTKCPKDLQTVGGFMGGGARLNFSPCMKYQLGQFLNSSQSNCLFKESGHTTTPAAYGNLPNLLPGQSKSPSELCRILGGPGYDYVPFGDSQGKGVCSWWVCLNENHTSPEYGRAKRFPAPVGFPCNDESFCFDLYHCQTWDQTTMSLKIETLRSLMQTSEWSEWSTEFSDCSRSCGTGVRIRRRVCQIGRFNLSPYCPGLRFQSLLCNTDPCPEDPASLGALRQARGDEVCSRFLRNEVKLKLKSVTAYFPTSSDVKSRDAGIGANVRKAHSKSCLLKCDRDPVTAEGDLDAIMPDGTPCLDTKRSQYDLLRFNITLRCVRGFCMEFSDCQDELQSKDDCGICGGDGCRCVKHTFGREVDVPKGSRIILATIPAGASNIGVEMNRRVNMGVILELWDSDGHNVMGHERRYPFALYNNCEAVPFAGTKWTYERNTAFLNAAGPTTETVVIKAYRGRNPIKKILLKYAKAATFETD